MARHLIFIEYKRINLLIESALAKVGIPMHWRRRAWDREHFPHATRGYFPFWERIRAAA